MSKIVIFGAGVYARHIAQNLLDQGDEILCFIDNDPFKANGVVELRGGGSISIYTSEFLQRIDFDRIVIGAFTGFNEIAEQLSQMGIAHNKINTSYVELSVRAREIFVANFAKEAQNLKGNVAELGVYRGDFARRINAAFPTKKLYLFDTFEGFNDDDLMQSKDGQKIGEKLGRKHFSNTSVEIALNKMPYKEQCVVKKGWFPQSAMGLENEQFCFVNLDADLHKPILSGLRFFYPKMVRGGVILIHDYFSVDYGVKEAVCEFMSECNLSVAQKLPIGDNMSVAIIKD